VQSHDQGRQWVLDRLREKMPVDGFQWEDVDQDTSRLTVWVHGRKGAGEFDNLDLAYFTDPQRRRWLKETVTEIVQAISR
jgi:hypothetical protein